MNKVPKSIPASVKRRAAQLRSEDFAVAITEALADRDEV